MYAWCWKTMPASICQMRTKFVSKIVDWLSEGPESLERRANNARRIARPNAVWEIAEAVWDWANKPKFASPQVS